MLYYRCTLYIEDVIKMIELEENTRQLQELKDRLKQIGDSL